MTHRFIVNGWSTTGVQTATARALRRIALSPPT
jgi:hypothetical protein